MALFGRVSTAMVTPFDKRGNIDFAKTTQLVEYLLANGTDSLVVAGTTGESATLTAEEKVALFRHVVKVVNKRVPVIAGTGSNNTYASLELTKRAEAEGVDGCLLVVPYYNKPNQQGIYQHFKTIAEGTSLPVMLYNVPSRTVANMEPETVIKLAQIPNVAALKDAGGSLDAMTEVIANTPDDFDVYSGEDGLTLPALAVGAAGVVSVASHVIGNQLQEMIELFVSGHTQAAAKLHQKLLPFMKEIFKAPSPAPIKTALQIKGLDVGSVRSPLVPLAEDERVSLMKVMQAL